MEFLGDTLAKIAAEKAGIMKLGVPVVIAQQLPEARYIFEVHAKRLECPIIVASDDVPKVCIIPFVGEHQRINAATAIAAFHALAVKLHFSTSGYAEHLAKAVWPARLQRLDTDHPLTRYALQSELWLDGGHNPAAAAVIAQWIAHYAKPCGLIIGMMQRKDIKGFLEEFHDRSLPIATITIPNDPAAAPAEVIAQIAISLGFSDVRACTSLETALHRKHEVIIICGSLYLAGKVLAYTV
jgi:dihydrofolate synthase/folylpolyglutamate synthase